MKRIVGIVVVTIALAFGLVGAGCSQQSGSADNAITVSASAVVRVPTDSASFTIAVQGTGDDESQAYSAAIKKADAVIDCLKAAGVKSVDKFEGTVEPTYGGMVEEVYTDGYWDDDGNWVEYTESYWYDASWDVVGYEATAFVSVDSVALSKLAQVLPQCAEAGAIGFSNLTFTVTDRDAAYKDALTAAVEAAKAKAGTLASASGVYVGRVVNMVEDSSSDAIVLDVAGNAALLDPNNPSVLDSDAPYIEVGAAVTVSYAIS